VNSISHRADFVKACLDLWERRAPFGTYNVTNPGFVTTRHVVEAIEKRFSSPNGSLSTGKATTEFYKVAAKTPRSNCVMDVSKILAAGVKIRPVERSARRFAQELETGIALSTMNLYSSPAARASSARI
jgi:dTDP-4-dehydrorhamnose reductase